MIPLFRLDILSMEEVLSNLDSKDLFLLSLLSKRATIVAQGALKKKNARYKLHISIHHYEPCVTITEKFITKVDKIVDGNVVQVEKKTKSFWDLCLKEATRKRKLGESKNLNKESFDASFEGDDLTFKWNDFRVGFKFIINRLLDFCSPNIGTIGFAEYYDILMDTIETVESRKIPVKKLELDMTDIKDDEQIRALLDKIPAFKTVTIDQFNPSEKLILKDYRRYENPGLEFDHGSWVTLPRLLTMDCEKLCIGESTLTSKELTFVFNFWIQGGMRKMKKWYMSVYDLNLEEVFEEVPHEINVDNVNIQNIVRDANGDGDIYTIERFDGVKACVFKIRQGPVRAPIKDFRKVFDMHVLDS